MSLLSKLIQRLGLEKKPLSKRDVSYVVELNKSQLSPPRTTARSQDQNVPDKEASPIIPSHKGTDLTTLPGVGPKVAMILDKAGYKTAEDVLSAASSDLIQIKGIGRTVLTKIKKKS